MTDIDDLEAGGLHGGLQHGAVAVVNLPVRQRLARRHQLVAGRQQRHAQARPHRHLHDALRGQQPDVADAEHAPRRQQRITDPGVLAARTDVLAGTQHALQADDLAVTRRVLLHDHRCRPLGDHRAGHDAQALPRLQHAGMGMTGEADADHLQRSLGRQVGRMQGIAVHCRLVGGRCLQPGLQRFGEHAPGRLGQRDMLRRSHRGQTRQQAFATRLQRQQTGFVMTGHGHPRGGREMNVNYHPVIATAVIMPA